jgi:hypothetical protein
MPCLALSLYLFVVSQPFLDWYCRSFHNSFHFLFVTQIILVNADIAEESELAATVIFHVMDDVTGIGHIPEALQPSARHFSHVDVPYKAPTAKPDNVLVA